MFSYTRVFNQPLGDWTVSCMTRTTAMFANARNFDQKKRNRIRRAPARHGPRL